MSNNIVGCRITKIRLMTQAELKREDWPANEKVTVLELDNGMALWASRDIEGNGPGMIFGAKAGKFFVFLKKKLEEMFVISS
ncbi:MAG TPA: hypothetical protein PKM21_16000 [Anaerolineales bacterium]|nr:hypothetical protein [Anaerolineales bacterium]